MNQKRADALQVGDRVVLSPERGDRSYPVLSLGRCVGNYPIEVHYQAKGTWHYRATDMVLVADTAAEAS